MTKARAGRGATRTMLRWDIRFKEQLWAGNLAPSEHVAETKKHRNPAVSPTAKLRTKSKNVFEQP